MKLEPHELADLEAFVEHLRAEINAHPMWPDLRVKLGGALELLGDPHAAAELYRAALEEDPARRWRDHDLREIGLHPDRVRRWFQRHHGSGDLFSCQCQCCRCQLSFW